MLPDTAQSFRGTLYIHVWIRFLNWKKKKALNWIETKLNMSFGLFHCCELTSCGFSASLFEFFFWPDYVLFLSPIFHYYLKTISLVSCSTPVMCRHISWTLDYVVLKNAHWITRIDLINDNNYNFKHLDIREQFIWLMSNEDNFWYDTKITFI